MLILRRLILVGLIAFISVQTRAASGSIKLTVDPRIELIGVIQLLYSDYPVVTQYDFAYKKLVLQRFAPYQSHRAVQLFKELSPNGFSFDAPLAVMLHLSSPPDLKVQHPFPEALVGRSGGQKKLDEFLVALRDFAAQTNFKLFLKQQKSLYAQILAGEQQNLRGIDIRVVERYYGMKQHSYNIILSPLLPNAGFGPRIDRGADSYDIYDIRGPSKVDGNLPAFGTPETFRYLAWHEFSHSFVNPITKRFYNQVAQSSSLLAPIAEQMRKSGYRDWETVMNELVVRAVTVRLAYRERGPQAGDKALADEKSRGFQYIDALCDQLKSYEHQRRRYPSFAGFYPEIVRTLEVLAGGHQ